MPSLMFDPENWRNAAPIGGGAYQGGGGGLGPGFFPAPAPAVPQAPYMTQPGSGQSPFIPRNGQPPPQMDGGYARLYPQPIPRQVGPPLGRYAQPGEGNWGNPRYMDPRVDAQLAWDAFVADEEANQREYDEAQGVPSLESLQGNYARGLKLNELMGKIPNINPFMGEAKSGIFDMGQAHAAREYAKGLQGQFEQDYLNEAMTDEGQDVIEDFLQSQFEAEAPLAIDNNRAVAAAQAAAIAQGQGAWLPNTPRDMDTVNMDINLGAVNDPTRDQWGNRIFIRDDANPNLAARIAENMGAPPPPAPPPVGPNFMPPSPVQGTSQWTNNPGLPPAQATVRQMAQDYGPLGSSAGLFESPAMAARREELQRAAEEAAAVEYQRDNEADDRMREEEAQRQEIEDRLAEMQFADEANYGYHPEFLF
jgi:hypothetical protein